VLTKEGAAEVRPQAPRKKYSCATEEGKVQFQVFEMRDFLPGHEEGERKGPCRVWGPVLSSERRTDTPCGEGGGEKKRNFKGGDSRNVNREVPTKKKKKKL